MGARSSFGFLPESMGTAQRHWLCTEAGTKDAGRGQPVTLSRHPRMHFPVTAHIVALAPPRGLKASWNKGESCRAGISGSSPRDSTGRVSRTFHPRD